MLVIDVTLDDDARGVTRQERIFFSVPPDFHVHNDLVAAALMAVMGRGFCEARFNFPISEHCASILPHYYRLDDVGPVDPDLEPRQPGRHLGISFSGGTDSTTLWTMLRDIVGIEFKVITAEFDRYHHEALGYASYHRDVSCWTNFRRVFGDRGRRFDVALPLLFADYADLHSFASGQTFGSIPDLWNDPRDPEPAEFLDQNAVSEAGGLREIHIMRCLQTAVVLRILAATAPERVERALHASAGRGTFKFLDRALMLRHIFQQLGMPNPEYLEDIVWLRDRPTKRDRERMVHMWTVWHWKHLPPGEARLASPQLRVRDFTPLEGLSLNLLGRYVGTLAELIPEDLREPLLDGFHAIGIKPFDDRDYAELETVRQFLMAVNGPDKMSRE